MGDAADSAAAQREQFMRAALEMARRGMAAGGAPVGACIACGDELIVTSHNEVVSSLDATAHAEIVAIREACRKSRRLQLDGCALYVTVEPCPMCLAACHYAGIREIYFAAPIQKMQAITGTELCVAPGELFAGRAEQPLISGGVLAAESEALLDTWGSARGGAN
ncbi:MAG: nucleoside deaminase [Gammaproteobacteria bacterium]|jgi:tRNA(adenine34) deaminase